MIRAKIVAVVCDDCGSDLTWWEERQGDSRTVALVCLACPAVLHSATQNLVEVVAFVSGPDRCGPERLGRLWESVA